MAVMIFELKGDAENHSQAACEANEIFSFKACRTIHAAIAPVLTDDLDAGMIVAEFLQRFVSHSRLAD